MASLLTHNRSYSLLRRRFCPHQANVRSIRQSQHLLFVHCPRASQRDSITDLHLLVGKEYAVNQELDYLAAASKVERLESSPHGMTAVYNMGLEIHEAQLLVLLRPEFSLLLGEAPEPFLSPCPTSFELF